MILIDLKDRILTCVSASVLILIMQTQAHAQTRQELELPVPKASASGFKVKAAKGANPAAPCFAGSDSLTATISQIEFLTPKGNPISTEFAKSLTHIKAPNIEKSLTEICAIRDQAVQALREKGWIASIQIPPQNLVDSLRLNVVAAQLTSVDIVGDAGPHMALVKQKVALLEQLSPFNEQAAERILLSLDDVPGLDLRLSLAPAEGRAGDITGSLALSFQPYAAFVNTRNYNSRRAGRETIYGRAEYYGLTKMADVTYVGAQTTYDFKEQFTAQLGHEFGIGENNIRVGADLTFSKSKPSIAGLDLSSEAFLANFRVSYPLKREPNRKADMEVGFDYVDQITDVNEVTLSEDAARAVYLRGSISGKKQDVFTKRAFSYEAFTELRQGLSVLGATETGAAGLALTDGVSASRPFGKADSFIVRAGVDVAASLGPVFGARARSELQWSDNPLLGYDEYSIGNLSIGRGYDPGANSGDRAIGGAFEISANIPTNSARPIQAFGFYDVVQVENLDFGTVDRSRTLSSLGGGLRLSLGGSTQAELTYAKPLDRALFSDTEKPTDRVMFSITTKFPSKFR